MARQGLVIRSTHQGDRRITRVALTPRGDELVQRFRAELQARLGERLSRWPPGAAVGSPSSPPLPPVT